MFPSFCNKNPVLFFLFHLFVEGREEREGEGKEEWRKEMRMKEIISCSANSYRTSTGK